LNNFGIFFHPPQISSSSAGFTYEETLTGFKYLGNVAEKAVQNGSVFLFAYEDAIGYLPGPLSYDKDGIR
jgi:phosphomannomutase